MVKTIHFFVRRFLGIVAVLLMISPAPVWAASFTVNSTTDAVDARPGDGVCETAAGNGICTLRAAIQETNTLAGADTIVLPPGNYVLTIPPAAPGDASGNLDIRDSLSLIGAGAGTTVIDGGGLDNVFASVGASKTIHISGITIQNGSVSEFRVGGGIYARSSNQLTLSDVVVRNNHAGDGGGIYNQGGLTLIRTLVEGNTAVRVVPGSIEYRQGGGIYNSMGSLTIRESTIRNNVAVSGGGLLNSGTARIDASTISENVATNNTLNDGDGGGGIVNDFGGTLSIINSTISGNRANGNYGGLYNQSGTATLSNATVASNMADADGDGFGSGGGLGVWFSAVVSLRNTIVAGNRSAGSAQDCQNLNPTGITSEGYNLFGNVGAPADCPLVAAPGDRVGDSADPVDPGLRPLADNGGPTLTHALADSSPAIDLGDPNGCSDGSNSLAVDQRGMPRSVSGHGGAPRCDSGAYELSRPVVDAGPDQRVQPDAVVALDGSGSTALTGIASYAWMQVAGVPVALVAADSATPSFTAPPVAGILTFRLTVTDRYGTTGTDTVDISVNGVPVANAGADQTVIAGASVMLNGTASVDTDGSIVTYAWTQTGGASVTLTSADAAMASFTAPSTSGTLSFVLTVTDNDGATHSDSVAIDVTLPAPSPDPGSGNQPPVADAGDDKTVRPRALVILTGWNSQDPDGRIVSYRWIQTTGPRVNLLGPSWPIAMFVAPKTEGPLTFRLTVTDNKGATATDTVTVTVDDCAHRWYDRFWGKHKRECR